jgi:hypothetical protein
VDPVSGREVPLDSLTIDNFNGGQKSPLCGIGNGIGGAGSYYIDPHTGERLDSLPIFQPPPVNDNLISSEPVCRTYYVDPITGRQVESLNEIQAFDDDQPPSEMHPDHQDFMDVVDLAPRVFYVDPETGRQIPEDEYLHRYAAPPPPIYMTTETTSPPLITEYVTEQQQHQPIMDVVYDDSFPVQTIKRPSATATPPKHGPKKAKTPTKKKFGGGVANSNRTPISLYTTTGQKNRRQS